VPAASAAPDPRPPARVLLLESVSPTGLEIFAAEGFTVEALAHSLPPDELARRLAGVDILGIRSKTQVPASVLDRAASLLAVGCFCIGTNQVDVTAANRNGVPVFNAPFSNTRSVAELMIAEIIALGRQLGDRSREVHDGVWRKVAAHCFEVRGKTLGIVGYGHIGRQLGVLAEGLGMRVIFHDHTAKLSMGNNLAAESLRDLLARSDFVSLHVPETPATKDLIGAAELAVMKKGSYLLNASRGTVVVIAALAEALRAGHLAGAAIDVYPDEPESNGAGFRTPLQTLPNVILTPHVGGSTSEAQAAIGREVATVLTKFVRTGATSGVVGFPVVEPPALGGARRILNVHRNVPGVLRDINQIVSDLQANIRSQTLATDAEIGYLVMDLDQDVSAEVHQRIAALPTNIRTRII
jgi:D-3-phosphoglycerate dehydrogenase / 2-oxoglutarate reductase